MDLPMCKCYDICDIAGAAIYVAVSCAVMEVVAHAPFHQMLFSFTVPWSLQTPQGA